MIVCGKDEAFVHQGGVEDALAEFETRRRDEVERTQHSADVSLVFFEHIRRFWAFDPAQFAFGVMTRSKAITYDNLRLRAPEFVDKVDRTFAEQVRRAEQWPWCSLVRWLRGSAADKALLAPWPLPRKPSWVDHVNAPLPEAELQALRHCVKRGTPFGDESWTDRAVRQLGLESTLRPHGRPRKHRNGS